MQTSLQEQDLDPIFSNLAKANQEFNKVYPGEGKSEQPVHTLYGGAQLFKKDSIQKIAALSQKHLKEYAPDAKSLAKALKLPGSKKLHQTIYERIESKLEKCAVEDFRIDFEDGYGNRPDQEEDATAEFTAKEVAQGMKEKTLSPFIGIRVKNFSEELKKRSVRTLDIFISTLVKETKGKLPSGFVITLPKVSIPEQVQAFVKILSLLEEKNRLPKNSLKLEIMIELTQSILNSQGIINLSSFIDNSGGRCRSAHFGTYDYTASCDITAAYQMMEHPACDFALHMMKIAYAGRGIWLSNGATSVMPVPIHRIVDGKKLSKKEINENYESVHRAWRLSYSNITHSLKNAYYQGWDLHPGQIPIRYAALYTFFLQSLDQASIRLKNFMGKAAQATLVGDVFDDAATGQGLLNYFLRALSAGAITEDEIVKTGLTLEELQTKSFVAILNKRKKK